MASAKSLPTKPTQPTTSAKIPANGPKPTAFTKRMALITGCNARHRAMSARPTTRSGAGERLLAASRPSGRLRTRPNAVASALGMRTKVLFPFAFALATGLAGLTGALVTPILALAPGIIATEMSEGSFNAEAIKALVPMKRAGQPEEVADLVAFLASERAAYISGQVISINGGMI